MYVGKWALAWLMLVWGCWAVAADTSANTPKIIDQEKSLYRDIQVSEDQNVRSMGFVQKQKAVLVMGAEFLNDPDKMVHDYSKMLLSVLFLNPQPKRVLVVGLGVGTVPRALQKLYPQLSIDTVELDATVLKLTEKYFSFKQSKQSPVIIQDGRLYIKRAITKGTQYDIVILDAFNGDYIPEHMLTKEFLEEVKKILTPEGVIAANTFSGSQLYASESATYTAVFGPFYNLKKTNRIILTQNNGRPALETVKKNAALFQGKLDAFGVTPDELLALFSTQTDWPADARVLTDQYSPANLLNKKN